MSEYTYQDLWDSHLDPSYDDVFSILLSNGLSWLPWVGRDFKTSAARILIVGESHYTNVNDAAKVGLKKSECQSNQNYTREIMAEYPLEGLAAGWENNAGRSNNPTFDNLTRTLLKTDLLAQQDLEKRGKLWRQLGFYNIVQRPMDYGKDRPKERPAPEDFLNGWRLFVQIIGSLQPKTCIFIGVEASNTFNSAMQAMGIQYTPVEWGDFLNNVYTRKGASVTINGRVTNLIFLKHTSQYFSWDQWNEYLEHKMPEALASLRDSVFNGDQPTEPQIFPKIKQPIPAASVDTKNIPTWLAHKPIVACRYGNGFGDDSGDAKYLSVGRAQYDQQCVSVKVFRHSGERWSRQSEEIPIHRLGYLMQMFLSTVRLLQSEQLPKQTSLHEEIVCPEELDFLRSEFHKNRDEIIGSLEEIKTILQEIDLGKI